MTYLRDAAVPGVEVLRAVIAEHRFPPHAHDTWTVALLHRGTAHFRLGGRRLTARVGDPVVIAPGVVHTGEPGRGGYAYTSVYLDTAVLAAAPDRPIDADGRLRPAVERLACGLARRATPLEVGELVEAVCSAVRADAPADRAGGHLGVRRAREVLADRWAETVTLAELAVHAGLSRERLIRLFHDEHGLPPHAYQLNLRLQHARRLLLDGETPARVAAATGFCDQAHLSRAFRRTFAVPPGRFARPRPDASTRQQFV